MAQHTPTPSQEPIFVTLPEAARMASVSYNTLWCWVQSRSVGARQGVTKVRGRWKVDWRKFRAAIEQGRL